MDTGLPVWASFCRPDANLLARGTALSGSRSGGTGSLRGTHRCVRVNPLDFSTCLLTLERRGATMPMQGPQITRSGGAAITLSAQISTLVGSIHGSAGASIIGGCCGTSPRHIEAIAKLATSGSPENNPFVPQIPQLGWGEVVRGHITRLWRWVSAVRVVTRLWRRVSTVGVVTRLWRRVTRACTARLRGRVAGLYRARLR